MIQNKIKVVVPAAGKGSRSGLSIPKSLQEVHGIPIIIRICNAMKQYDAEPIVIINPKDKIIFQDAFNEHNINVQFLFQTEALGMGHALLQAESAIDDDTQVLLTWSDIPFLQTSTINGLVNCHNVTGNTFSFASFICDNPYTVVHRENGRVIKLLETHKTDIENRVKRGERDIGLFIFDKKLVMNLLKESFKSFDTSAGIEFGFLSIVQKLVDAGYKTEAYPIANEKDVLSFNTPDDLQQILKIGS